MKKNNKDYRIEGRPRTIYRVVKSPENPYVMIDRRPIDNPVLSFKAKGILTYLMSRPDGWEVSVSDLINHATDGEDSIRSGLKELKQAGHMRYSKMRERGRITGWLIEVYELPHTDFPDVAFPDVENPTQVLNNLSNNKQSIRKKRLTDDDDELNSSSSSNSNLSAKNARMKNESTIKTDALIADVSGYWIDMAKKEPTRTLRTVFKRVFNTGVNFNMPPGQIKTDLIDLIDTTFLNKPKHPENYITVCVRTLQNDYERANKSYQQTLT